MAKQLRQTESGTKGVRRILRQQVGKALKALREGGEPLADDAVHEARKRLKKGRAYLRLLRKALGQRRYRRANAAFRDTARPLTELRDAKVLLETLDGLVERFGGEVDKQALEEARRALREQQQEVRRAVLEDDHAREPVEESLETAENRVKDWPIGKHGWSVLGAGLKRIYRAGRDAFTAAQEDPSVENLHKWRKQVKYLWYQLQ